MVFSALCHGLYTLWGGCRIIKFIKLINNNNKEVEILWVQQAYKLFSVHLAMIAWQRMFERLHRCFPRRCRASIDRSDVPQVVRLWEQALSHGTCPRRRVPPGYQVPGGNKGCSESNTHPEPLLTANVEPLIYLKKLNFAWLALILLTLFTLGV